VSYPVPALSLPSVPILELNCFIHDDDPRHIFPVKIASTESVGTLKEVIMEKNPESFRNVDARSLALWRASTPLNDGLKENASNIISEEEALSPVQRMSALGDPQDGHVHIIVVYDPPTGEFVLVVSPSLYLTVMQS
jgi:hypothetical protein